MQQSVDRPAQRVAAESRDAEDQIGGDVFETRLAGFAQGVERLARRMAAVHQPQAVVVERLDADRDAVEARFAQRREVARIQIVGVGFEGGLLRAAAIEQLLGAPEQSAQRLRRAERGGAAAEVARADRFAAQVVAAGLQLAGEGCDQCVHAVQLDALVEVAVGADALAEGYVEIDSGHTEFVTD